MGIKLIPLGGFGEVGRNCLAVDVDGKIILLDMGFHLERYLEATEDDFAAKRHVKRRLISSGALPDVRLLRRRRDDVVGIVCSHAHLDHIGAIPFLASHFSCPVHATPYTSQVIRSLVEDRGAKAKVIAHDPSATFTVGGLRVEFIPVSHSTPQTVAVVIHTGEGAVIYANDYKEDTDPPFGLPTDISRLKELKGSVRALVLDSLYAPSQDFSEGERVAREDVLSLKDEVAGSRAIVVSTFSSHIYRLQTLCDLADSLGRAVVFMGRSLDRYMTAASETGILDLASRGKVLKYRRQIDSFLRGVEDPSEYFFITTGHQGEPEAVLRRMADGLFDFHSSDSVIFSCNVIPVPTSIQNRRILESLLKKQGVHIISDVHVSGHAFANDHDHLLSILCPDYLIPSHAEPPMIEAMRVIASKKGITGHRFRDLVVGDELEL
ncbi:MAG: MBL fold metallo-hydrolase [Candidatus Woesearchaeota archaeon]